MKPQTKIYIGLAVGATLAIGILGGAAWSNFKIAKLEMTAAEGKQDADQKEELAAQKELEAARYRKDRLSRRSTHTNTNNCEETR